MNKQAVITLLAAIAVFSTAYEFNDPLFNQILANELEELHDSIDDSTLSHTRNRRHEEAVVDKCKPRRKKLCCAEESIEEYQEKDKEVRKECFKQVISKDKESRGEFDPFKCDRLEKWKRDITCIVQCVGQKKNVLDKDGNVKEDDITAFTKENMSKESWFASIQDKVISTCLAEAKNATANRDTSDNESCNPAGVKFVHCLFREIQLGCPAEQIKDQKACTRVKDRLKKHEFFHVPPPHHFMHDE